MAQHWFKSSWQTGVDVSKAALWAGLKSYVPGVYTLAELRALTSEGLRSAIVEGRVYRYDATDTTTADDGDSVIVTADGARFKLTAGSPVGSLTAAQATLLDDISAGFNGSATAFTLKISTVNYSPVNAASIRVFVSGVLQKPGDAYTIAGAVLTFTFAPATGEECFIIADGAHPIIPINAVGTFANRAAHNLKPAGFGYLSTNGDGASVTQVAYYFKLSATSGDWSALAKFQGEPGSGVSDGNKGDVTVSGSGAAFTINNDAVTYAKMQNVSATDKLLGRSTAGAGDVEEIACTAAGRALIAGASAAAQRTTLSVRETLVANRTYYVRTDGSNSNDGLANTSGGAFLTIQKAIDVAAGLDIGAFTVTVQVADGTYTGATIVTGPWLGNGTVQVIGNTGTPANVIISTTSADCFTSQNGGRLFVNGMELRTTTSGNCLFAPTTGAISFGSAIRFGACANYHMFATTNGAIVATANYSVVGAAQAHFQATTAGVIQCIGRTVTLSGSQAYVIFASCARSGTLEAHGSTFTGGTITGNRYFSDNCAVVFTNGGGANFFPGSVAGSTSNGGQYN